MPVIEIKLAKGRSVEQKREAAKALTEAAVATLGVAPEHVTVIFTEYDRADWATAGTLHQDKYGPREGS